MTLEDLAEKMDTRFDKLDGKVDNINTTVAVHTKEIAAHDRENAQNHKEHEAIDARLDKVERWMWFTLGAGGAAGAGIAKLFLCCLLACFCLFALAAGDAPVAGQPTRAERSARMRAALKVDEAKLEARRYERQRRRLNNAAAGFYALGSPSNAVTAAQVDFATGDITVQWADGSRVVRRFDPALSVRNVHGALSKKTKEQK